MLRVAVWNPAAQQIMFCLKSNLSYIFLQLKKKVNIKMKKSEKRVGEKLLEDIEILKKENYFKKNTLNLKKGKNLYTNIILQKKER